jgi:hypothetical protein
VKHLSIVVVISLLGRFAYLFLKYANRCGVFDKRLNALRLFIQAENYLKNRSTESGSTTGLKDQSFGQPETVKNYSMESQKYLRTRLPIVQRSLQLYLANRETEFILFRSGVVYHIQSSSSGTHFYFTTEGQ